MFFLKKHFFLFLVIVLSVFSILPLFQGGFFPMHDDTQVARVFEMGKALKDGMFPVRWVADLGYGYGYPIFNFYAPLAYYFGGFFNILGFDALIATKIMMGLGIVLSGIFMYLLAKEFWGKTGGLISALFYVYAPYHALDIYVRGDVAEFYSYAFIPLAFLGFYKVFKSSQENADLAQSSSKFKVQSSKLWKWVAIGSIGYAGVILSHNLTAMMVTPFLFIFIFLNFLIAVKNKKLITIRYWLYAISLGLIVSAFYWLPALLEMKYTNVFSQIGGGADFRDHFVCPRQLWDSQWMFGGSVKGCIDGMSFMLGKFHILLLPISLILLVIVLLKNKFVTHSNNTYHYSGKVTAFILSFVGLIASIALTLEVSKPLWESFSLMAFLQYPWRFLILSSFFVSFLSGSLIYFLNQLQSKTKFFNVISYGVSFLIIFFLIYFNFGFFQAQNIIFLKSEDLTSNLSVKWIASKTSDEYMPKDFEKPDRFYERQIFEVAKGKGAVQTLIQKTNFAKAEINTESDSDLRINIAYFPTWKAYLDGKEIRPLVSKNVLMAPVNRNNKKIEVKFEKTGIEKFSEFLSLIGIVVLAIGIIYPALFQKFKRKVLEKN